jgi:hypothetical protein
VTSIQQIDMKDYRNKNENHSCRHKGIERCLCGIVHRSRTICTGGSSAAVFGGESTRLLKYAGLSLVALMPYIIWKRARVLSQSPGETLSSSSLERWPALLFLVVYNSYAG